MYLVAGKVGGIQANMSFPAEFLYDNLMIHSTVVEASRRTNVTKLLYLGSSCIYPRLADQPITEDQPNAIRLRLHLGDAYEPLRSERQF